MLNNKISITISLYDTIILIITHLPILKLTQERLSGEFKELSQVCE